MVQLYASWAAVPGSSVDEESTARSSGLSLQERTAVVTLINFERVFIEPGGSKEVTLIVDPRHYAVIQEQPLGPPTTAQPNGSWVPPIWEMQSVSVTLHVGGQQPTALPRLPSNVLQGTFQVKGDNTPANRCPKFIPHQGL
eukprot:SAG31_NODE_873_length_11325_cov_34.061197_7_plen_141_part_00